MTPPRRTDPEIAALLHQWGYLRERYRRQASEARSVTDRAYWRSLEADYRRALDNQCRWLYRRSLSELETRP
jgi:hypothetical protein